MSGELEIMSAIDDAEEIGDAAKSDSYCEKPRVLVDNANPDVTVAELRDVLAHNGGLYDRGVPVKLARDQSSGGVVAKEMTPAGLTLMAHQLSRPYRIKRTVAGDFEEDVRLPGHIATMYLQWSGEWQLPILNDIASSPILSNGGDIAASDGYDPASGMWCENVPDMTELVPGRPTRDDAAKALQVIRETFKTFPFTDAAKIDNPDTGVAMVDTSQPPAMDESSFINALMTAACRPSLHLAPALLVRAPSISGAGTGKGLLVRCISVIAFGREPSAVTDGGNREELEKRISAELMAGSPVLFLDNLNGKSVGSDLLASAITERPSRARVLGKSKMVSLNATAFIALTGNGLECPASAPLGQIGRIEQERVSGSS